MPVILVYHVGIQFTSGNIGGDICPIRGSHTFAQSDWVLDKLDTLV